jgi:hypothetical protein
LTLDAVSRRRGSSLGARVYQQLAAAKEGLCKVFCLDTLIHPQVQVMLWLDGVLP